MANTAAIRMETETFLSQFYFRFARVCNLAHPLDNVVFNVAEIVRHHSLVFREARFEKLENEKLHFEAGSFVLELLSF